MQIITLPVGPLQANCYIVFNPNTKEAIVIDPGAQAISIIDRLDKRNLKTVAILLTHGHSDHIGALEDVQKATGAKVYIHKGDAQMLTSAVHNLSTFIGADKTFEPADELLTDGQVLELAGLKVEVIATPGHTKGGCCFKIGEHVFVGDSIFLESIGRTDFPGGSYQQLIDSIKGKILTLPDDTNLYPGHGPSTTVAWERRMNPFLH